ncbi:hypothetical protein BSLA_01f2909 [Burkholderia stabilis]|nr:hypothetical protein BSLA_01f2909 [Burkholderia stabilis]
MAVALTGTAACARPRSSPKGPNRPGCTRRGAIGPDGPNVSGL